MRRQRCAVAGLARSGAGGRGPSAACRPDLAPRSTGRRSSPGNGRLLEVQPRRSRALVEVLKAGPTATAAEQQLAILERTEASQAQLAEQLRSLARRLPAARHAVLVDLARRRFPDDIETPGPIAAWAARCRRSARRQARRRTRSWAESTARAYIAAVQADRTAKKIAARMTTAAELVRRLELPDASRRWENSSWTSEAIPIRGGARPKRSSR